jgi:hypothetical protein
VKPAGDTGGTRNAVPGVFAEVVHSIGMSKAGLLYVSDRQ